ncbi:hypothetical protein D1007_04141 [Hordeum vulgare]|nr:hypothetical protein D1007_04141 [Hordeum vulgare]
MTMSRGAWDGIDVDEGYIECLRHRRKLSSAEHVAAHIAGAEYATSLQDGEKVVFVEHFARGLGLPVITFFRRFLTHFALPRHHLSANAYLQLAVFFTMCDGFVEIEPRLDLSCRLFYFKKQTVVNKTTNVKEMAAFSEGFFYVKNIVPAHDFINMPDFFDMPLVDKLNWQSALPYPIDEVDQICTRLTQMADEEGLPGVDLLATMVARLIQPL